MHHRRPFLSRATREASERAARTSHTRSRGQLAGEAHDSVVRLRRGHKEQKNLWRTAHQGRARSCADLLVPEYRRTMNARTEKRADEESKKFDEKQNDLPSKLAEGITTELRSYPKRIITQFQLKL